MGAGKMRPSSADFDAALGALPLPLGLSVVGSVVFWAARDAMPGAIYVSVATLLLTAAGCALVFVRTAGECDERLYRRTIAGARMVMLSAVLQYAFLVAAVLS